LNVVISSPFLFAVIVSVGPTYTDSIVNHHCRR
jgi:hypothetical protein